MSITKTDDLLVKKDNGVLYLSLNRPDRLNAFSPDMIAALKESIQLAKADESIKVVVISGNGRAFSAGGDVKSMGQRNTTRNI